MDLTTTTTDAPRSTGTIDGPMLPAVITDRDFWDAIANDPARRDALRIYSHRAVSSTGRDVLMTLEEAPATPPVCCAGPARR